MYNCDICKFYTDKASHHIKHIITQKHKKNIELNTVPKSIIKPTCNYCQIIFTDDKLLVNHIKICTHNPDNKICKHCNTIFNKETKYFNHIETCFDNRITKLENNNKKLQNNFDKLNEDITKYLCDSSSRTKNNNNSYNDYLNLYFRDAPTIKKITDFNICNNEILTENGYVRFIDELIYYYESNIFVKFIGNHIIKLYKKDNMQDQSVYNTDASRLNYIIKKENEGWHTDKRGIEFVKISIEPLLIYIKNFILDKINLFKNLYKNNNKSHFYLINFNKCDKLNDIIIKIETKMTDEILNYISSHFYINKENIKNYLKQNNINNKIIEKSEKYIVDKNDNDIVDKNENINIKTNKNDINEEHKNDFKHEKTHENFELCKQQKNSSYTKKKEMEIVHFLQIELPNNKFIHNKSVGSECSGTHLFPDILFKCLHYNLIVEIDEHQHKGNNYKCEEKRMYDIIAKIGQPCIFIRYNPDNKKSNKKILLEKIKEYLNLNKVIWNDFGFKVEYLFYD